jgi:hypothetical protein
MKPIDYFKKTFVGVFVFITIFKLSFQLLDDVDKFTMHFVIKNIAVAFITALVMGVMNYYAKIGFLTQKENSKPKDN